MNASRNKHRIGWGLVIALVLVVFVLGLFAESAKPLLQYQRSAMHGEYWRLLSAHIVHLNLPHTLLNLGGLALILYWLGPERRWRSWASAAGLIGLGVSLGLYIWQPQVTYYVGLSGVLHGLVVFGLAPQCAKNQPFAWVAILAVAMKLAFEQVMPQGHGATEVLIAGPVLSIVHLYGAIVGAALSFVWILAGKIGAWQVQRAAHSNS